MSANPLETNSSESFIRINRKEQFSPKNIGKKVLIKAEIVAESDWLTYPLKLMGQCIKCGQQFTFDLRLNLDQVIVETGNPEEVESQKASALLEFASLKKQKIEQVVSKIFSKLTPCSKGQHIIVSTVLEYGGYRILKVRDYYEPTELEEASENEYREATVYAFDDVALQFESKKRYLIHGVLCSEPNTRKLVIVAEKFEPLHEEFEKYEPTEEELALFNKFFAFDSYRQLKEVIDGAIAPYIRGTQLAKVAAALTIHSPIYMRPPYAKLNMPPVRAWLRTAFYGDSRTGKSSIIRYLTLVCGIGERVVAETASRTGLIYTIDSEKKLIKWGVLVLNDRRFVGIEGFHGISRHEMPEFREAFDFGEVRVMRMVSGRAFARTRIVADMNPKNPMDEYMYKCMAIPDTPAFREVPDITRWDYWIPFWHGQAKPEEIASKEFKDAVIPPNVLRLHTLLAWKIVSADQIIWGENKDEADEIEGKVRDLAKEKLKYVSSQIPLIHPEFKDWLYRTLLAFSALNNCFVKREGKWCLLVKVDFIDEFVKPFLEDYLAVNDYMDFVRQELEQRELEQAEELFKQLKIQHIIILESLKINALKKDDLALLTGLKSSELKDYISFLRVNNLVTVGRGGFRLTGKGLKFVKFMEERHRDVVQEAWKKISDKLKGLGPMDEYVAGATAADTWEEQDREFLTG